MPDIDDRPERGFVLLEGKDGQRAIKCLACLLVSYNRNDVEQRYCGHCHKFHEDLTSWDEQSRALISKLSIR